MNEDFKVLKPSLIRALVKVFLLTLLYAAIGGVFDRYRHGHWWTLGYIESLAIPLLLMPTFVCIGFAPKRIEYSDYEFYMERWLGRGFTLRWSRLYSYGTGNNVFLLQFEDVSTIQIYAGAFDRNEWRAFVAFLKENYPEKKASFWFGPRGFR